MKELHKRPDAIEMEPLSVVMDRLELSIKSAIDGDRGDQKKCVVYAKDLMALIGTVRRQWGSQIAGIKVGVSKVR